MFWEQLKIMLKLLLNLMIGALLLSSCGNIEDAVPVTYVIPVVMSQVTATAAVGQLSDEGKKLTLDLTDPDGSSHYVTELANCDSGLSKNHAGLNNVEVYVTDEHCIAKLVSFNLNGLIFSAKVDGATDFKSWEAGQKAVFKSTSTNDLINVKVEQQLSSPVLASDQVKYSYLVNIEPEKPSASSLVIKSSQSLWVAGQDAPNFKIITGDANYTQSGSEYIFSILMSCKTGQMIVGGTAGKATFCLTDQGKTYSSGSGVDIYASANSDSESQFSYKMIADTDGKGLLTLLNAQKLFNESPGFTVAIKDLLPDVSTASKFKTIPLHVQSANKRVILVLRAKSRNPKYKENIYYSSFQYFPISLP